MDEELYDFLVSEEVYKGDYESFKKKYSDEDSRRSLHSDMVYKKLYQGGFDRFESEFYSDVKEAEKTNDIDVLHRVAVSNNLYSGNLNDFSSSISSPESRKDLHQRMLDNGLYSGNYEDFKNTFFKDYAQQQKKQTIPSGPTFTQKVGSALSDLIPGVPALEAAKSAAAYEETKANDAIADSYLTQSKEMEAPTALEKVKKLHDNYMVAIGAKGNIDYRESKKEAGAYDKGDAFKDDSEALGYGFTALGEAYKRLPKEMKVLDKELKGLQGMIASNKGNEDLIAKANERTVEILEEMKSMDAFEDYRTILEETDRLRVAKRELVDMYPDQVKEQMEKRMKQATIDAFFKTSPLGQQYGYTARAWQGLAKGLAGIATLPRTVAINNEYGWTDGWGEWVDDVEEAVVPTLPTDFQASMIEKGELKTERILPKVFGAAVDMGVLMLGTKGLGAAGLGKASLGVSGILNSHNDYYKAAMANPKVTPEEASKFAIVSSISQAMLEYVSPQSWIYNKKAFQGSAVKNFLATGSPKQALKFAQKEILGENMQEAMQMVSDKTIEAATNAAIDREAFDPTKGLVEEGVETMITTTLISAVTGGFGAVSMRKRPKLYNEAIDLASNDPAKFTEALEQALKETQVPGAENIINDIKTAASIKGSLPEGLSAGQKSLITEKQMEVLDITSRMKDAPEAFQKSYQEDIQRLSQEIEQIANEGQPQEQQAEEQPSATTEQTAQQEMQPSDADPQATAERVEAETEEARREGVGQEAPIEAQDVTTDVEIPTEGVDPTQQTEIPTGQAQVPTGQEMPSQEGQVPPTPPPVEQQPIQEGQPEQKVRGFQERSLAPEAEKPEGFQKQVQDVTKENFESYTTMKLKPEFDQARERVKQEGQDAAFIRLTEETRIDAKDQMERMALLEDFGRQMEQAVAEGNNTLANTAYEKINRLQSSVSRIGTRAGQASAALAIWNALTPQGTVEFIKRSVNREKGTGGVDPQVQQEIIDKLQAKVQELEANIAEATQTRAFDSEVKRNASKQRKRKGSRKKVAKSIVSALEAKKVQINRDEANDITRVIGAALWNTSLSTIQASINAGLTISESIEKGIAHIKERFQGEGFNEDQYRADIKQTLEEAGITDEVMAESIIEDSNNIVKNRLSDIKDVARRYYEDRANIGTDLAAMIASQMDIPAATAQAVAQSVEAALDKLVGKSIQRTLYNELLKQDLPKDVKKETLADRLSRQINMGSLDAFKRPEVKGEIGQEGGTVIPAEEMQQFFAEASGIDQGITPEQAVQLEKLAKAVSNTEGMGLINEMVKTKLMDLYDSMLPPNRAIDEFWGYYYASILMGPTTHIVNTASNISNLFLTPFRDASDLTNWVESMQEAFSMEGTKKEKLKTAANPFFAAMDTVVMMGQGLKKGRAEAMNALKRGDVDNKYLEQISSRKGQPQRKNVMENERPSKLLSDAAKARLKNAKNPALKVAGKAVSGLDDIVRAYTSKSKQVYRYTGRSLAAEDAIARASAQEAFLSKALQKRFKEKGYRGQELREKVLEVMSGKFLNQQAIADRVDMELQAYEDATGEKPPKEWAKMRSREIENEMLFTEEEIQAADNLAREAIFTGQRDGTIAKMANMVGRIINSSPALSAVGKPYVPFTRVVGNVVEYMLDHTPVYGFARANGMSVTGIANIAARASGQEGFSTAQMGRKNGSLEEQLAYEEQMGRAWFGTLSFLSLGLMVLAGGNDEDSIIQVTGGEGGFSNFVGLKEKKIPPYSMRIGSAYFNYQLTPALTIPLTIIGAIDEMNRKYPERLRDMPDEDINIYFKTFANAGGALTNLSFLKSVSDMQAVMSDLSSAVVGGEEGAGKFEAAVSKITRKYGQTALKPLPTNANLVKQIEKFINPTSYGQKDAKEMLAYALGVENFGLTNKPNIDIFGEEVQTFPGESMIPYSHWLGIRGKDRRWLFLNEHDAVPMDMRNMRRELDPNAPKRKMTPEELYQVKKSVGKEFDRLLSEYMRSDRAREEARDKDTYVEYNRKKMTRTQKSVLKLWSKAKRQGMREFKRNSSPKTRR